MRYSRTGVVAVLLAAEVFIGAAIVWALVGRNGWSVGAAGFRPVSQSAKTYTPIDAGSAPHVVIDDPDSRVVITTSTDGRVHVTDDTHTFGWVWSAPPAPLTVDRTNEGVSIRRADQRERIAFLGIDFQRTEVALPSGALLEIQRCGGADVSGVSGTVNVHSVDGSIALTGVHASQIKIASDDGSLHLNDVRVPSIDAVTSDGSIRANQLHVDGGRLQTSDGSIRVALADVNLRVSAHTGDGSIRIDGRRLDEDSNSTEYQVGTGGSSLVVSTQDGSIHISTNGAL